MGKDVEMISNGFVLRQLRELCGILQWQMAAKLSVSQTLLCDYEKGRKPLPSAIRRRAEKIFEKCAKESKIDIASFEVVHVNYKIR